MQARPRRVRGGVLARCARAVAPSAEWCKLDTVNEDMLLMSQAPLVGPRRETISVPGRTFLAAERRLTRLRQAVPTELTFLLLGRPRAQAARRMRRRTPNATAR